MTARFDVGDVIRRVSLAWRQEGDAFRSKDSTWSASADERGLHFTPGARAKETLTLGWAVVRRGDHALPSSWRAAGGGVLEVDRGTWTETVESSEAGLSQSWRFARRPEGRGPLEVSLPVDGALAAATPSGLHFRVGALQVRYGHATWVDARGKKTAVPARFADGAVRLTVPEEVVTGSEYPAVLDPLIGPETGTDQPVLSLNTGAFGRPAVAAGGAGDYLVAWRDGRCAGTDVIATRISAAGAVLDPSGILLLEQPSWPTSNEPFGIAWNGSSWLVAWQGASLQAVRVSAAGVVLDTPPIALASTGQWPAVASNGTDFLVVWGGQGVTGRRVSGAGVALDPGGLSFGPGSYPSAAWGGGAYLVAWDHGARRVSSTGSLLDSAPIALPCMPWSCFSVATASSGADFLVVWEDRYDVRGTRISGAGVVLDPTAIDIEANPLVYGQTPGVAWNGTDWVVAWHADNQGEFTVPAGIQERCVSTSGALVDAEPIVVVPSTSSRPPAPFADKWNPQLGLACTGAGCLVAYRSFFWDWPGSGLFGVRFDASGMTQGPPQRLDYSGNRQQHPAIGWDGTNYLLAWEDTRNGAANGIDIYGVRVTPSGTILDPTGLALSTAPHHQERPSVASNGSTWVVSWRQVGDSGNLTAGFARVSATGVVLDPAGIALPASPYRGPTVAASGPNFLFAWAGVGGVEAVRADATGALLDSSPVFLGDFGGTSFDPRPPSVAADNGGWLAAWTAPGSFWNRPFVRIARLASNGQPSTADGGVVVVSGESPLVASNGSAAFLAWIRVDQATNYPDLRGALLNGTVLNPDAGFSFNGAVLPSITQTLAFDGAEFVFAWTAGTPSPGRSSELRGARVSATGRLVDPSGFLIAETFDDSTPALACGNGQCRVATVGFDDAPQVHAQRVWSRPLVPNRAPSATDATVTAREDTVATWSLPATDADSDPLTFTVDVPPAHGQLSVTAATGQARYVPEPDFHGADSFTFQVTDRLATAQATVSITIEPVNDVPVGTAQALETAEDAALPVTLAGADVDRDALTFDIVEPPAHGALSGSPPAVTYRPAPDFVGVDRFTFSVSDGAAESTPAEVTLTVTPVNDAPVAMDQSYSTEEGVALDLTLPATDADGDALAFTITAMPGHGTLTGVPPALRYTPSAGFQGGDTLTFIASDGQADSQPATVTIAVRGAARDAGPPDGGTTTEPSTPQGCGCASGFELVPGALLALLLRRRRTT